MITVVDFAKRQRKTDGSEFFVLILQGGLSLVQSRNTGNYYATVKRCSIPSTFDEETAKGMVGETVPGSIQRKDCEPYGFTFWITGGLMFRKVKPWKMESLKVSRKLCRWRKRSHLLFDMLNILKGHPKGCSFAFICIL